jgi:hypothetical protein
LAMCNFSQTAVASAQSVSAAYRSFCITPWHFKRICDWKNCDPNDMFFLFQMSLSREKGEGARQEIILRSAQESIRREQEMAKKKRKLEKFGFLNR